MSSTNPVKRMAELLKSGAVMLAETCPVKGCNLPLFKLKSGEIICPVHGKVYLVRTEEEEKRVREEVTLKTVLDKIENRVINVLNTSIEKNEIEPSYLIEWLEVLERIYRVKRAIREK
ncbi:MAG: Sjogren's syndrome/scleroderma autoantigen 1 family protein [Thermoprotei archaeon]